MATEEEHHRSILFIVAAITLLLLMGLLAGGAALRESVAFDEVAHIGAGISYVQKFDLRLNEEHPPLVKILAVLPLVVRGVNVDYSSVSWTSSQRFLPDAYVGQWVFGHWLVTRWNDSATILAWTRFPMLLLTLALGWLVFRYAREIGGDWGGLLCLSMYVSSSLFLTFGPMILTDTAIAFFSLGTLWAFAQLWQEPTRKHSVLLGVWLGCSLLSKFSAGLLFVTFVAFSLSTRWRPVPGQPASKAEARAWRRMRWRATFAGIAVAAAIVYVVYFVFSWNQTHEVLYRLGSSAIMTPIKRLLMPPWLYLRGMLVIVISFVRPMYILGKGYPHGKWFYFPVLLLLKSTLGFLVLAATAALLAITRRWTLNRDASVKPVVPVKRAPHWRVLWIALVVYFGMNIVSMFDVSLRHFSVPQVLLFLLLAPVPNMIAEWRRRPQHWVAVAATAVVVVSAASSLVSAVRTYPYYMPYFNSIAGRWPTYFLASDSNVDWNHALPDVRRFADKHGLQRLSIDTYAFSDPAAYVPNAEMWNCQKPTEADAGQWVVVSSNMIEDVHNCSWLLRYPRETLAGGSMYAFQLPSPIPLAGATGGPPLAADYRELFGFPIDVRPLALHMIQKPETMPAALAEMAKQMSSGGFSQKKPTH